MSINAEKRNKVLKALREGKTPEGFEVQGWGEEFPLLDHQLSGVLWAILTPKGLLADSVGVGKTGTALGLLQWLRATGKLSPKDRAIIIVPAISIYGSWEKDGIQKFVPDLPYAIGRGTKAQRMRIYQDPTWSVLLTNYETMRNDVDILQGMGFKYVILDEADAVRNHTTKTAKAVKRLTKRAKRVLAMTATPVQNHLMDLHGIMEAVGLNSVFGTAAQFRKEYEKSQLKKVFYNGSWHWQRVVIGYKNTGKLKTKLVPFYLRRTYKDISVAMPEIKSQTKYLEMNKEQRRLYREVQSGFASLTPDSPPMEIRSAALRLRQICTTTALLSDRTDSACKFDWIVSQMKGDWQEEKVVIFSNWKVSIAALCARLKEEGIGYVIMTGDVSQEEREDLRQQFWDDPDTKILIGTTAIEKSLNLQCARVQVNMDMLWNASRHKQLAGRVQRIGSIHDDVYVFTLVVEDSIEQAVLKILQEKQALADHMFDEESKIFEKLSTEDLLKLIRS